MRVTLLWPFFTLSALLVANSAYSQIGQAEILGSVSDASGAVLPGVTVTATQVGVGVTRTTVADSRGRYTFTQLPVGRFEFVFELSGFSTSTVGPMELNLGERPTLNVTMQIAGVAETILVEPVTPQIETTRSEISHTIQNIQIQELPVLGRDWLGFAVLAPGIKSDGSEGSRDGTPTAGVGVGRQDKVLIDGADVNNRSVANGVDIKLSKEVIAEFEVKTNQFDAQLGQSGTSITQAVTRSGTDRFGGSAFFFFRDDALNAETSSPEPRPSSATSRSAEPLVAPLSEARPISSSATSGRTRRKRFLRTRESRSLTSKKWTAMRPGISGSSGATTSSTRTIGRHSATTAPPNFNLTPAPAGGYHREAPSTPISGSTGTTSPWIRSWARVG